MKHTTTLLRSFEVLTLSCVALCGAGLLFALSGCKPRAHLTIAAATCEQADVQAAIDQALDGDTVTIPAGTASWTKGLFITKAITLQGNTGIANAGKSDCAATDNTIIKDDLPRSGNYPFVSITASGSKLTRMTGISFLVGSATGKPNNPGFRITNTPPDPATAVRIDHCHFGNLALAQVIGPSGWVYGVTDHNLFEFTGQANGFLIYHATFGGADRTLGNGAFEAPPYFGTDKFWFIEDNTFKRTGTQATGVTDSVMGGRFVFRHNYVIRGVIADHGTEAGSRGVRAKEVYDNTFDVTGSTSNGFGGSRGGANMIHDNILIGPISQAGVGFSLTNFRTTGEQSTHPLWGTSDGTSVWDANDTEGTETFVEGNASHVFAAGTATTQMAAGTMQDTKAAWSTNQWAGYSIHNPDALAPMCYGSRIRGNDATQIFYDPVQTQNNKLVFAPGNRYEIRKVLIVMDGCGWGRTDQQDVLKSEVVLHETGQPGYPHPVSEPCYSWNNFHQDSPQEELGFNTGYSTIRQGRDYFNLGNAFPKDSTPEQVKNTYDATRNGEQYTGTFSYPHPLTLGGGGGPSPTPISTGTPQPSASPTATPYVTPTPNPAPTETPAPASTPTPAPTAVATPTPTATPTATPVPTASAAPSPITLILHPGDLLNIFVPPTPTERK